MIGYDSDEKSYGIQSKSRFCAGDGTRSRSATPFLYALTNSVWTSGQIFIAAENCLRTLRQRTRGRRRTNGPNLLIRSTIRTGRGSKKGNSPYAAGEKLLSSDHIRLVCFALLLGHFDEAALHSSALLCIRLLVLYVHIFRNNLE